ncbi:MAG: glycosyltransferase family 2 protein [Ignavibacteria bacterium]|nr:glycosyltransferase family 2 protein [Ignavibacteria bacterium]
MISIIIVNHNTGSILLKCIDSLKKYESDTVYEVIIIDNCSTDDSREIIKKITKDVNIRYIFTEKIISFSAANNLGINKAKGEFILIMNPDIIFTEPVLQKLILGLDENTGAICPALIGTDGNFQRNYFQRYPSIRQFIYYNSILAKFFNKSAKRMNKFLENQDIDISTGEKFMIEQIPCAFYMTTKKILKETGLMDENYKLFFEDVDLSYRTAKKYELIVDTSVKVTHLGGSSFKSPDNWNLHGRYIGSMLYFFRKHYGYSKYIFLKFIVINNSLLILLIEKVKILLGKKDNYRYNKHKYLLKVI